VFAVSHGRVALEDIVKKTSGESEERIAARVAAAEDVLSYRTGEAARVSGMSERTIQRLISEGVLASVRVGAIRLVRRKTLEKFLADRENSQE
jgi:excisionase family DNA binding protein